MKKTHSQNSGTGREWKKSIPKIREREGNEKIHSQSSGKGIRDLHSWEWPGTGIPAHPCRSPSKAKAVSRAEMSTSSHFFLSFAGFDDLDLMWQFLPNFTILTRFDILTILNNFCTTKKSFTWGWFIYIAFTDLRIKATQKIHQK